MRSPNSMMCTTNSEVCTPSRFVKHDTHHDTFGSILSTSACLLLYTRNEQCEKPRAELQNDYRSRRAKHDLKLILKSRRYVPFGINLPKICDQI